MSLCRSPARGLVGALLLALVIPWLVTGCAPAAMPEDADRGGLPPEARAEVTVSITARDISTEAARDGVSALAFSHDDIARLRVDVSEDGEGGQVLFRDFDLTKVVTGWSGTLPFLPKDTPLVFLARAFDASGKLLFRGTLHQTLHVDHETVIIPMAPSTDGASIALPRLRRIHLPAAFASGQGGGITFFVEATSGAALTFAITAAPGDSGSFLPSEGAITLQSTAGAFVSQYLPPAVTTETSFTHTVTVKNADGHSVSTTFTTRVLPPEASGGFLDTRVSVLFNPVIEGLDGQRLRGTDQVVFTATVKDDGPAEALQYAWSFTPAEGTSQDPLPVLSGQTRSAVLSHYTPVIQGDLRLAVTDGDNGTTTLTYTLAANPFPDDDVIPEAPDAVRSIAGGTDHTCALFNNGSVRCWGRGMHGQLGYGNGNNVGDTQVPYGAGEVKIMGKAVRLAVGGNHSCVLMDTGLVRCWGQNTHGQLGLGHKNNVGDNEAVASLGYVNLGGGAVRLAAGLEHTCAVLTTGRVRCWGRNQYGQLGYRRTDSIGDDEYPSKAGDVDLGGATARDITAGRSHTCALLSTGKLLCWGRNFLGQLGYSHRNDIGDDELPGSQLPVSPGGDVAQVSAGGNHTCAVLKTGSLVCWGSNQLGQNGTGNGVQTESVACTEYSSGNCQYSRLANRTPVDLGAGVTALQVSAGTNHTCARLSNSAVRCWGFNHYGRLGYGNMTTLWKPWGDVDLGGGRAYQVAAANTSTCVVLSTGKARCWGRNTFGRLGYGHIGDIGDNESPNVAGDLHLTDAALPAAPGPAPSANLASIGAGVRHTCALSVSGEVRCWGASDFGQLGYGDKNTIGDNELPYFAGTVNLGVKATALAVGGYHSCVLHGEGKVRCWGLNTSGQLGYGHTKNIGDDEQPWTAGDVELGGLAIRIAAGGAHTCAVLTSGKVRCWGGNYYGPLGYGNRNTIGDDEKPWEAGDVDLGGATATNLAAGDAHTCALLSNGKLLCWGHNWLGQLGYAHTSDTGYYDVPGTHPQIMPAGSLVSQVSASNHNTCARLQTGAVICWGSNYYGQNGVGSSPTRVECIEYGGLQYCPYRLLPSQTAVSLGTGVTASQVSAGGEQVCVAINGSMRCWGYNAFGQLGYGNTTSRSTPGGYLSLGTDGAVSQMAVSAGNHTCVRQPGNIVRCWGEGSSGQLGYGNTLHVGTTSTPGATVGGVAFLPPDRECTPGNGHGDGSSCGSPSCGDGQRNQGETGVDCGGPCAAACGVCRCTGGSARDTGPIPPETTYCGMRVCGTNSATWVCTDSTSNGGWQYEGNGC